MYSELLPKIRTTEEAAVLCWELDELANSLFMTADGGWDDVMANRVRISVAEILKSKLPQELESRSTALREIKEEILTLPVVRLTLAIEPTEELVEDMVNWLRNKCNPKMVLDIYRDSLIVAGAIVTYNGKFADYSMAMKMDSVWKDNSEKLLQIVYATNH
jgi:hypothetical protein